MDAPPGENQDATGVPILEEDGDNTGNIEANDKIEGEINDEALDVQCEDVYQENDENFNTDDEICDENMKDIVIANPEAESRGGTPIRDMNSVKGSIKFSSGRKSGSKASSHIRSNAGSRASSIIGSIKKVGRVGSSSGSKHSSKVASPNISEGSRNKENHSIKGSSPVLSQRGQKNELPPLSLPVLLEEDDQEVDNFKKQKLYSHTSSVLSINRTLTPSHGILKTPNHSTPITPSKVTILDDAFRGDFEKRIGDLAECVEVDLEGHLVDYAEVGMTPLKKLRSRANSFLQAAGSRVQSRMASRIVSPTASRKSGKGSEGGNVKNTLELAADALAEQTEGKDATKDKANEDGGQKAIENGVVEGDPNATGNNKNDCNI